MGLLRALRTFVHLVICILTAHAGFVVGLALSRARCAACRKPVAERRSPIFCAECAASVNPLDQHDAPAAVSYGAAMARAIHRLKYEGAPELARPIAHVALRRLTRGEFKRARFEVVVPVPLHPNKLAERGYNQSALLAREVARHLGATFEPLALERTRHTESQAKLDRASRETNVRGAFSARGAMRVRGKRVLLVDDVVTTGATTAACRDALLEAGAIEVRAFAIAHQEKVTPAESERSAARGPRGR